MLDKHFFKFEDSKLTYSRTVSDKKDHEIDHPIEESELKPKHADTWTESLFYGVGNKNM